MVLLGNIMKKIIIKNIFASVDDVFMMNFIFLIHFYALIIMVMSLDVFY